MNHSLFSQFTAAFLAFIVLSLSPAPSFANELHIQWLGGPSMLIKFGDIQIVTDPMLGEGKDAFLMGDPNESFSLEQGPNLRTYERLQRSPDITPETWDAVFLSHSHEDHFDQAARSELPKTMQVVAPKADADLITSLGFENTSLLDWGQTWELTRGDFSIDVKVLPAHHSLNEDIAGLLGKGNGYLFTFTKDSWSKTLYWTGDSFVTSDLQQALSSEKPIDLFVPHLGRVGTTGPLGKISMGAKDTVAAIKLLQPSRTLPIHHSTYPLYLEPISELLKISLEEHLIVDVVSPGVWLVYK